ncbi:MAG TPA: SGNH/GDSL hydrolase family protein, partial [Acidobacteriota bacterium]|nr:SGNH/GDSL hydrolase family protein [Acidobacteriota bacterium]
MKLRRLVFFSCLLIAMLGLQVAPVALLAKSKPKAAAPRQGAPDFSRLVVIGASISAGFQSNAFFQSGQVASYPNLLAKQVGSQIVLPLISDPGIPPNGQLQLTKPVCSAKVGDSAAIQGFGTRANPTQQATLLSVPGHKLLDVLSTRPTTLDPSKITITDFVLGLPGLLAPTPIAMSQIEWVAALKPTTLLVAEVGGNDALGAVLTGTDASLTPLEDFRTRYTEIMTKAKASGASTIVTLNIPDLTSFAVVFSQDDISRNFGINKETLQFV